MSTIHRLLALLVTFLLTACASIPSGPSVMALPGSGKNFNQFRIDDYQCRQFAHEQVGGVTPNRSALASGATSAAIGTGLGAAAGALIGHGTGGGAGYGAAVGAGSGLIGGGIMGSGAARASGRMGQHRYDNSYVQCMYAQGHRVPVHGQIIQNPVRSGNRYQNTNIPPPPPGNPPPPPPN